MRLVDCLPPDHLARFLVDVIAQLDLSALYARCHARGGAPYAPAIRCGRLTYGYATGVFRACKIERAAYESARSAALLATCTRITIPLPRSARPFCPTCKTSLSRYCCWRKRWAY